MVAIGIVLAPRFFRIARVAAVSVSHELYIEAAHADGCSRWRMLWRHVLPNSGGPLLVQCSFALGFIVTAEASLSYIGLGVTPPTASWGNVLRDAFNVVHEEWFTLIPPVVAIALTVLAFMLLGDGVRDALGRDTKGRT
jgi:peptide/nickel transport system permease protein